MHFLQSLSAACYLRCSGQVPFSQCPIPFSQCQVLEMLETLTVGSLLMPSPDGILMAKFHGAEVSSSC